MLKKDSKKLRQEYNLSKTDLIVDYLTPADQATLSFAHVMQIESLEIKDIQGYYPVKGECGEIMKHVAEFREKLRQQANNNISGQEHKDLPGNKNLES